MRHTVINNPINIIIMQISVSIVDSQINFFLADDLF